MRARQFEAACREIFRGWRTVTCYEHGMDCIVTLTVSALQIDAARNDLHGLMARLFNKSRVEDLVRTIERNQRLQGLRRYGRKHR